MTKLKQIVVFILLKENKLLVEKRSHGGVWEGQFLFPGGAVEHHEEGNLELALKREAKEELGIEVLAYEKVHSRKPIFGWNKVLVNIFLIKDYIGNLPQIVLDRGDPLIWVDLQIMINSPIRPVSEIAQAIQIQFIANK